MPFPEIILSEAPPPDAGLQSRADIAFFAGLVRRRAGTIPASIRAALEAAGWAGSGPFARTNADVEALLDVPVAVTSWDAFEALFDWKARPVRVGSPVTLPCAMGLAVRSFFAEGGVKAWIVRTGDPLPLLGELPAAEVRQEKRKLIAWSDGAPPADSVGRVPLLPGFSGSGSKPSPHDPASWTGAALIWGVEDTAMLALPDLAELCGPVPALLAPLPGPPAVPEQFKPCAPESADAAPEERSSRPAVTAPRLDRQGYRLWAEAIRHVLDLLNAPGGAAHRRDVMLVASFPLPAADPDLAGVEQQPLRLLDEAGFPAANERLFDATRIGSARLQIGWPWVATEASASVPEGIEAPEGVLMGAIARTSLKSGAFRSAAGTKLNSVLGSSPILSTSTLRTSLLDGRSDWMGDRLCLIAPKPDGITLVSDATMSNSRDWRAGGVSRLMAILLRAARWLGQERLFDPAGPELWSNIVIDFEGLLSRLWQLGALAGASPSQAFDVRCDETTTTQADIDAGRTIVNIAFVAAQPVQRIEVSLALADTGIRPLAEAA